MSIQDAVASYAMGSVTPVATDLNEAKRALQTAVTKLTSWCRYDEVDRVVRALREVEATLAAPGIDLVDGLNAAERELAARDLIGAVKAVRSRAGLSLKEAKDLVDAYRQKHGFAP